jgi:hypothetical protein
MNKIISYSLWGNNPKYTIGAIRNAEMSPSIYPGWTCRFYICNDVDKSIIESLMKHDHVEVFIMGDGDGWANMFWRFYSSFDDTVEYSIFRDTDSRLSLREKYAVDEWINSGKTFHIMRDHPFHNFPILGGMWGYRYNNKYQMSSLIKNYNSKNQYGTDYEFLGHNLYPQIGEDKVVHDPFFDKKVFPEPRVGSEFVGDVFDEYDNRHLEYQKYII